MGSQLSILILGYEWNLMMNFPLHVRMPHYVTAFMMDRAGISSARNNITFKKPTNERVRNPITAMPCPLIELCLCLLTIIIFIYWMLYAFFSS